MEVYTPVVLRSHHTQLKNTDFFLRHTKTKLLYCGVISMDCKDWIYFYIFFFNYKNLLLFVLLVMIRETL
jgi:hypothetical protein